MGYAAVNGLRMWYEVLGKGEPMVLVPGGGLGHENWDPVLPYFERQYRLLLFDLPGYGDSESADLDSVTFESWADDVVALMDAIGWEKSHISGSTTGGVIALAAALRHPARFRSVIADTFWSRLDVIRRLYCESLWDHARLTNEVSGGIPTDGLIFHIPLSLSAEFFDQNRALFEQAMRPALRRLNLDAYLACFRELQRFDLSDRLAECRVPVLIIAAELSRVNPPEMSPSGVGMRRTFELLPDADLVVFRNTSHTTIYLRPKEHADVVSAFTDGLQVRGRRHKQYRALLFALPEHSEKAL